MCWFMLLEAIKSFNMDWRTHNRAICLAIWMLDIRKNKCTAHRKKTTQKSGIVTKKLAFKLIKFTLFILKKEQELLSNSTAFEWCFHCKIFGIRIHRKGKMCIFLAAHIEKDVHKAFSTAWAKHMREQTSVISLVASCYFLHEKKIFHWIDFFIFIKYIRTFVALNYPRKK